MTITVKSLTENEPFDFPYYPNMPTGMYATYVVAKVFEFGLQPNGDLHDNFILNGAHVFTKDNRDKPLREVMQDGSILFHTQNLGGGLAQCLIGNGNTAKPTRHHLTLGLSDSGDIGPSASKKRKI
jgi:hypothetical protein